MEIDGAHHDAKNVGRDEAQLFCPEADDTHNDAVDAS
jgi:hypothetical protein